jgi:hypothetical protein
MLEFIYLLIGYCIYLFIENIYNGFILHYTKEYIQQRKIELGNIITEIPDDHYYFETSNGKYELRKPIFIPFNEYNKI